VVHAEPAGVEQIRFGRRERAPPGVAAGTGDTRREQPGGDVVAARRDGQVELDLAGSIALRRPADSPAVAGGGNVVDAQQAGVGQALEVEGCQPPGDAEGGGDVVAGGAAAGISNGLERTPSRGLGEQLDPLPVRPAA